MADAYAGGMRGGFTLIEMMIAVAIAAVLLLAAVPSFEGWIQDRKLRASLEAFDALAQEARRASIERHEPVWLVWSNKVPLLTVSYRADVDGGTNRPVPGVAVEKGAGYELRLPQSLAKEKPSRWTFWASGNCEPAVIRYEGPAGWWELEYDPLTAEHKILGMEAR